MSPVDSFPALQGLQQSGKTRNWNREIHESNSGLFFSGKQDSFGLRFGSVIRQGEAPDGFAVDENGAQAHAVFAVSFQHGDEKAIDLGHNAHMVRPAGAIPSAAVSAAIIDEIAGQGNIAVLLLPATQSLEQLNLPLAAAFGGDDVC